MSSEGNTTAGPKQHRVKREELETRGVDGRSNEDELFWMFSTTHILKIF